MSSNAGLTRCYFGRVGVVVWACALIVFLAGESVAVRAPIDPSRRATWKGEPRVDLNSGSASIRVPVEIPRGTLGHQPKLALVYSSGRSDGLLGVGWRLEGAGLSIACTARFGVPDYAACQDYGMASGHRYEMHGELLVGPDTTMGVGTGWYHPFVENFERVEPLSGGPDEWRVRQPDGGTRSYGGSEAFLIRTAPGGPIASWLLHTSSDAYGNEIHYEYITLGGSAPDRNVRLPHRITYADGARSVEFVYEPRPDPRHDHLGGIERVSNHRLREIRVTSNGEAHHLLVLRYGEPGATNRSRLAQIQRFGRCPFGPPGTASDTTLCSALPPRTFSYSDAAEAEVHWEQDSSWDAPSEVFFNSPLPYWQGRFNQLADVNGDALPDLIADANDEFGDVYVYGPKVYLNNGVGGWETPAWIGDEGHGVAANESARWTSELRSLRFARPRMRVTQTAAVGGGVDPQAYATPHLGVCDAEVVWDEDLGVVQMNGPDGFGSPPFVDGSHAPRTGAPWFETPRSAPFESTLYSFGNFHVVDLDADGRADLVASIRLSGLHESLTDCGSGLVAASGSETWVEGAQLRVVFRNTGEGWVRDDGRDAADGSLADSLPPFGLIAIESSEFVHRSMKDDFPALARSGHGQALETAEDSPCDEWGLGGVQDPQRVLDLSFDLGRSYDLCFNTVNLEPTFPDLNGDGYPDLIVTEYARPNGRDPLILDNHSMVDGQGGQPDPAPLRFATTRSVAWLQFPRSTGTQARWRRAPEFDPPIRHAQSRHLPGSPATGMGFGGGGLKIAHAHVHRLDLGVRFADLNRDGLADLVWAFADGIRTHAEDLPAMTHGVLINRGGSDSSTNVHSAWCGSTGRPALVPACPAEADPFVLPENVRFADLSPQLLPRTPRAASTLAHLVDLNGDGWVDLLSAGGEDGDGDPQTLGVPNDAWIHQPGRELTVWQQDVRFRSPLPLNQAWRAPGYATPLSAGGPGVPTLGFYPAGILIRDVTGDGLVDYVYSGEGVDWIDGGGALPIPATYVSRFEHTTMGSLARSDLLRETHNGRGGVTSLLYAIAPTRIDAHLESLAEAHSLDPLVGPGDAGLAEPVDSDSAHADSARPDLWFAEPVVETLTTRGPNRAPASTHYRFAHPRWCPHHRSRLGYRLVERTAPDGSSVRSYYWQSHGRARRLSKRIFFDAEMRPRRLVEEVWRLADPGTVTGGWGSLSGSSSGENDAVSHNGRLVSRFVRNEYADVSGEAGLGISIGAWSLENRSYDDEHGYNLAALIKRASPTSTHWIERVPVPYSPASGGMLYAPKRVAEESHYADAARIDLLSRKRWTFLPHDRTQPSFEAVWVGERGDSGAGRWLEIAHEYDAHGNLRLSRSPGTEPEKPPRIRLFCYDGDVDCVDGETIEGHGSGSMLVAMRDALGVWSTMHPHTVFDRVEERRSDYVDLPTERRVFDAFGRIVEEGVIPARQSVASTVLTRTYFDFVDLESGQAPYRRVTTHAADVDDDGLIETTTVSDGFGGSWKTIVPVDGGTYKAVIEEVDANASLETRSHEIACAESDPLCVAASHEGTLSLVETTMDELGRIVSVNDPHGGLSLFRYEAGSWDGAHLDSVLEKNAKGDLTRRLRDGGNVAVIEECMNFSDPGLMSLAGTECRGEASGSSPDRTVFGYSPLGELERVHDAYAVRNGALEDPGHTLAFLRDTLGQTVSVDDPDGGRISVIYDDAGNRTSSLDARGVEVFHTFDALDRPVARATAGEPTTTIHYKPEQRRRHYITDGSYKKTFVYDDLGRTWRETLSVAGVHLHLTRRHDLAGRLREVQYPSAIDGVIDTLRYEYAGRYLKRVCDLGAGFSCFDPGIAQSIIEDVEYDDLGRRSRVKLPGGDRDFAYDGPTRRPTRDAFSGSTGYSAAFHYTLFDGGPAAYDELGNLTKIRGESSLPDLEFGAEYAYDPRNRISRWVHGSDAPVEYAYDELGNLTLHAGRSQTYRSDRPHALAHRDGSAGETITYAYDAAGNVASVTSPQGATHFGFDSAGRFACSGPSAAACTAQQILYDLDGKRIRETGSAEFLYVGDDFRYRPESSGDGEYWIEVRAFGERVAYKHVMGGALRGTHMSGPGLFGAGPRSPAWDVIVKGLALSCVLGLAMGCLLSLLASPAPGRALMSVAVSLLLCMLPRLGWAGGPLASRVPGLATYVWVLSDFRGSGLIEVDAAGMRLRHVVYSPFGEIVEAVGIGMGRDYYAGHDRHPGTGLVFMQARWLDPGSGRFLSVDPLIASVLDPQAHNPYSYANQNPISLVDPTGMGGEPDWEDVDEVIVVVGDPASRIRVLSDLPIELPDVIEVAGSELSGATIPDLPQNIQDYMDDNDRANARRAELIGELERRLDELQREIEDDLELLERLQDEWKALMSNPLRSMVDSLVGGAERGFIEFEQAQIRDSLAGARRESGRLSRRLVALRQTQAERVAARNATMEFFHAR